MICLLLKLTHGMRGHRNTIAFLGLANRVFTPCSVPAEFALSRYRLGAEDRANMRVLGREERADYLVRCECGHGLQTRNLALLPAARSPGPHILA